jgi:hypothetical protein
MSSLNQNPENAMPPGFGYEMLFAGQRAQHSFMLHHHISRFILANPKVDGIVEIGTALGALSIYLGLWGARLGVPVDTFDHSEFAFQKEHNFDDITAKPIFEKLGITLHRADVFTPEGQSAVIDLLMNKSIYLFCDGGNKAREFRTFVPFLGAGSIVSTHDWPGEIKPDDVAATVADLGLVPFEEETWGKIATATWMKPK